MEEFLQILTNFGFPIALSCYLLLRFEKILNDLKDANIALVTKNEGLRDTIEELKEEIIKLRDVLSRRKK